ncbi:MAG: hypothetical protein IT438_02640 [Phycisphaerales bacterium]|nr:hypothetical protein [Phycisphaerales bacterium]
MSESHGRAELLTVGVISRRLSLPVTRIEYIIESRNIEPIGMAGNARVFDESVIAEIKKHAVRIAADKVREA